MRPLARIALAASLLVSTASADAPDTLEMRMRRADEGDAGVALSAAEIARVIAANRPTLKRCYEDARARAPNLRVRLRLHIVIEPSGKISSVTDEGSELPNDGVRTCVGDVLRKATFPRPTNATHAIVPFSFIPPDPTDAGIRDARAD